MNDGKFNRVTTFVVIGVLIFSFAGLAGCGGYAGSGGGGGSKGYSITGTVVDSGTLTPVAGAQVVLEQPDTSGIIDRVIVSTTTLSDGSFSFSPSSGSYDVVVDATVTATSVPTVTYAATVVFGVPANATLNQIPLVREFGSATSGIPAKISSTVSASGSSIAFMSQVDVKLSALQSVSPSVGTVKQVTIPTFPGSTVLITTSTNTFTNKSCAIGTTCADYNLFVPEGNVSIGTFSTSGIQYMLSTQQAPVTYTVEGMAFSHGSTLVSNCQPSTIFSVIGVGGGTISSGSPMLAFNGCF